MINIRDVKIGYDAVQINTFYTTVSFDQVIELDKRQSMSAHIEYNSTGVFIYMYQATSTVF